MVVGHVCPCDIRRTIRLKVGFGCIGTGNGGMLVVHHSNVVGV